MMTEKQEKKEAYLCNSERKLFDLLVSLSVILKGNQMTKKVLDSLDHGVLLSAQLQR